MNPLTRRDFIKTGAALAASTALRPQLAFGADQAVSPRLTLPTPAQIAWQDCEIGLLYSFDLAIAAGDTTGNNASRKTWDPNRYQPRKLDTDQWMEAAKACGARYAVFTATHFNGFMQWQSDLYPYGLKQTTWRDGKGDVVADFVASCRKAGIKPGLYFSVHRNVYQQVWGHYVDWGKGRGTPAQEKFNRIAERQLEELCSRYGPLAEIWFDAGTKTPVEGGPDMLPIFEKHQPDCVFYSSTQRSDHRWIGNEAGYANYPCWATMPGEKGAVSHNAPGWKKLLGSGDPDGAVWSPGMVDVPLRGANKVHDWFWAPDHDHAAHPSSKLVEMYGNSVGRNCNFIIGEVIKPDGLVPDSDIQRLAEFGRELERRWGKPVAETTGTGATVELKLPAASRIASVVIMEDIALGECIQSYTLGAQTPGGQWQEPAHGQSIGHKRIERFPAIEVTAVRLVVDKSKAAPRLRELAACSGA
jgi:alpha-L-fucosidase